MPESASRFTDWKEQKMSQQLFTGWPRAFRDGPVFRESLIPSGVLYGVIERVRAAGRKLNAVGYVLGMPGNPLM